MIGRKKKSNKKIIIIGIVTLITLLLGITAYSIKVERELTFVEKGIKDSVIYIGQILGAPFNYIKDNVSNNDEVTKKYNKLLEKNESIAYYEARIKELEKENEDLKKITEINHTLSEFDPVNATVIQRNMGYWFDTLTIDKGLTSGIQSYMPVVVHGKLIGYVSSVSNFTSTIKLLTSSKVNTNVSVKIEISEGKYSYGLLTGYNAEDDVYIVEGISDYTEIPMNAIVTTTGLGDRFPSGIVVGKVKSVTTDSYDLARIANVKPDVNMNDISHVTILKRKASS